MNLQGINATQTFAGQTEVDTQFAIEARQEEAASDVGQETNAGFRHGKQGVLGSNSEGSVHRQANTSSHWKVEKPG